MQSLRELESSSREPASRLLQDIRQGATDRLGPLLDSYRNYLRLLATTQIDGKLQAKISPSDLVQETMLGAYRDFAQFRGDSERQFLAWLRQILINRLHVFVQKQVLSKKRDLRREISLEDLGGALARSTANIRAGLFLADQGPSPSAHIIRRENAVRLADHLAEMPDHYREIIVMRNLRGMAFDEIAEHMQRTSGAVRMMWLRAIGQLRQRMEGEDQPT